MLQPKQQLYRQVSYSQTLLREQNFFGSQSPDCNQSKYAIFQHMYIYKFSFFFNFFVVLQFPH